MTTKRRVRKPIEFAVYKGDTFKFIGTAKECAERLEVKADTIRFQSSPTYRKRMGNSTKATTILNLGVYEE